MQRQGRDAGTSPLRLASVERTHGVGGLRRTGNGLAELLAELLMEEVRIELRIEVQAMACSVCGGEVMASQRFCSACGTRVAAAPPGMPFAPPPPFAAGNGVSGRGRVEHHVHTLGILWCVYGALRLGTGLIGMLVLRTLTMRGSGGWGWGWPLDGDSFPMGLHPMWLGGLLPVIAGITLFATVLALLTGYALLTRQAWGRPLAIVVGVLTLIKLPLGTALGIYTLWVLGPQESGAEYAWLRSR